MAPTASRAGKNLFGHPPFFFYFFARTFSEFSYQIAAVAVGWQIYARDILHTGPWGLGLLRGAPALGALLMAVFLARHEIKRRAGMRMFEAVIVFGMPTIVPSPAKGVGSLAGNCRPRQAELSD